LEDFQDYKLVFKNSNNPKICFESETRQTLTEIMIVSLGVQAFCINPKTYLIFLAWVGMRIIVLKNPENPLIL
jgi:hypothetical protein